MKRSRAALMLLCLLIGGSAAWWRLHHGGSNGGDSTTMAGAAPAPVSSTGEGPSRPANGAPDRLATKGAASTATPVATNSGPASAGDGRTGPRYKRAYMLSLDKGALALVDAQDVEGDFAPRRGKEEEWSNMLRFRLMSDSNKVLAEELLPAPDHVCRVLDPRAPDGRAVTLAGDGPVVFQVRLPRVKGATRLDIFRILQPGEPATENLVGSLPLPHP